MAQSPVKLFSSSPCFSPGGSAAEAEEWKVFRFEGRDYVTLE